MRQTMPNRSESTDLRKTFLPYTEKWVGHTHYSHSRGLNMGKYNQTRDGERPYEQVDPSKIVKPKKDDEGKHSDNGKGGSGGSRGSDDEKK